MEKNTGEITSEITSPPSTQRRSRRIPRTTPLTEEQKAAHAKQRAEEEAERALYPAIEIHSADSPEVAIGDVELYRKSSPNHIEAGHIICRTSAADEEWFRRAEQHWTEVYAHSGETLDWPEWHADRYYVRNGFQIWYGPFEATADDQILDEVLDWMGRGNGYNVIDKRTTN